MATFTTTTKYALRWLTGGNLISDIDAGFQALAEDIDANMAGYSSGTQAARPAAGVAGRLYRSTDLVGGVALDNGSAWQSIGVARVTTSLPTTNLYDGQTVDFVADATNGVLWRLRYNAGGGTYKWECVGAIPLQNAVNTTESVGSSSYADLTTVGPSITVPLAGEYMVAFGATVANGGGGTAEIDVGLKIGAAAVATTDTSRVRGFVSSGTNAVDGRAGRDPYKITVASAATVVKLQYQFVTTGGGTAANRTLSLVPIRVA
jgi:hypothetical protein